MSSPAAKFVPKTAGILSIGAAAADTLSLRASGNVLAAFARSFYLQCDTGLACIGDASLGSGPLNVCLAGAMPGPMPVTGARWRHIDGRLLIDGWYAIALRNGAIWRPPELPANRPPLSVLALAGDIASQLAPSEGIGRVIPILVAGGTCRDARSPLLRLIGARLSAMAAWVAAETPNEPPGEVVDLLGLGPGLTPSGDDALAGAMIAIRIFAPADAADRLAAMIMPCAATSTSVISRAHLACAARGTGHAALHDALAAIASADAQRIARAFGAAAAIGHSSGWDALAGAVAVLAGLARQRDQLER